MLQDCVTHFKTQYGRDQGAVCVWLLLFGRYEYWIPIIYTTIQFFKGIKAIFCHSSRSTINGKESYFCIQNDAKCNGQWLARMKIEEQAGCVESVFEYGGGLRRHLRWIKACQDCCCFRWRRRPADRGCCLHCCNLSPYLTHFRSCVFAGRGVLVE